MPEKFAIRTDVEVAFRGTGLNQITTQLEQVLRRITQQAQRAGTGPRGALEGLQTAHVAAQEQVGRGIDEGRILPDRGGQYLREISQLVTAAVAQITRQTAPVISQAIATRQRQDASRAAVLREQRQAGVQVQGQRAGVVLPSGLRLPLGQAYQEQPRVPFTPTRQQQLEGGDRRLVLNNLNRVLRQEAQAVQADVRATRETTQATQRKTSAVRRTTQEQRNQDDRGQRLLTPQTRAAAAAPAGDGPLVEAKGAAADALNREAKITGEVADAERRLLDAKNRAALALGGEATTTGQVAGAAPGTAPGTTVRQGTARPGRPTPSSRSGPEEPEDPKDWITPLKNTVNRLARQLRLLQDPTSEYRQAVIGLARGLQRRRAFESQVLSADGTYIRSTAQLARARAQLTLGALQINAGDKRYVDIQRQTAAARRTLRTAVRQGDISDPDAIKQIANERDVAASENVRVLQEQNRNGRSAVVASQSILEKSRHRAATIDQILNLEGEERRIAIETLATAQVRKRKLDKEVQSKRVQTELEVAAAQGIRPTRTQLLGAWAQGRQTGQAVNPLERPTFGQGFTSRFMTTAQFALSGVALRQMVQGIASVINEAEELERVFSLVRNQFEAMGEGDQLNGFRREILEIARTSGVAASEVALVGFQMKGAFGGTREAIEATNDAIKVSVVTGLEQKELTDSLTAASKAYGVSIEDIGDAAIGLEERFGVLSKESLKVFGDLAIIASEAGLSIKELGAIIGVVQQASGRSGAAIAEGFSRILPAIDSAGIEIARLYQSVPALQGKITAGAGAGQAGPAYITEQLRTAQTGKVMVQLIRDYDKLDDSTKRYLLTLLGGRRETQYLVPLFKNAQKTIAEFDRTESDSGKTAERYADIQKTLAQTLLRLREELRQIGDSLARSGLLDFAKLAVGGLELLVRIVGLLARGFANLSDGLDGLPGKFAAVVAGIVAIRLAMVALQKARTGQTIVNEILANMRGLPAPTAGGAAGAAGAGAAGAGGGLRAGIQGFAGGLISQAGRLGKWGVAARGTSVIPGIGGAVGALGGAGAFAATAGVLALDAYLIEKIFDERSKGARKVAKVNKDIEKTVQGHSLRRLDRDRKIAETGWEETTAAWLLGQTTPETDVNRERQKRTIQEFDQAIALGYTNLMGVSEQEAKDLQTRLRKKGGGGKAGEQAYDLLNRLSKETRDSIDASVDRGQALWDKGLPADDTLLTAERAKQLFSTGQIGIGRYIETLRQTYITAASVTDQLNPEKAKATADALNDYQAALDKRVQGQVQLIQTLTELGGGGLRETLPQLAAVLSDALKNPELAPETSLNLALQLAQGARQTWLEDIGRAPSAAEAQRLAGTQPVLDPLVEQTIREKAGDQAQLILDMLKIGLTRDEIQQQAEQAFNETIAGIDAQAARTEDPAQLARYQRQRITATREKYLAERRRKDITGETIQDPLTVQQTQELAASEAEAARTERDNQRDITDARLELARARQGGAQNAVRAAKRAQEDARVARDRAVGVAASVRAEAQQIEADRSHEQAIFEVGQSRLGLLQAVASAAGRDAEAARYGLQQAQSELQRQIKKDPTDTTAINNLRSTVTQQQEQYNSTWVGERRELIDFQREMGEITVGQAIAQLQALLASPEVQSNEDRVREIKLAIRGLQKETAANLQFNIGDLKLPTFYEVKRAQTAAAMGVGYSDRRVVNVTLNNYNAMDYQGAIDQVVDLFNAPSRYGTSPSLYPGRN